MHLMRSAWRYLFARPDIRSAAPLSVDEEGTFVMGFTFVATLVPVVVVASVATALLPEFRVAIGFGTLIAFAVVFLLVLTSVGNRHVERYRELRKKAKQSALRAGFSYQPESPLPSPPTVEAVFQYFRRKLVAHTFTEVTTGVHRGYRFTAGHLLGYQMPKNAFATVHPNISENIVMVRLPGLLPATKLRDRAASRPRDYGIRTAWVPTGVAAVDARWDVQSNYPRQARVITDDAVCQYLEGVPLIPCTIVVRNGYLIACRDPEGSFESIMARLDILIGLAEVIPEAAYALGTTGVEAGAYLETEGPWRTSGWTVFRK